MRIDRLFRFPFKGLPAEAITSAQVEKNAGLTGDRIAAFSNGSSEVLDGQWQSCSNFTILKNDKSLQKWSVSSQPPFITVSAPFEQAEALTFDATSDAGRAEANKYFSEYLPAQGKFEREVVTAGSGMFDSQYSGLSFINPNTVKALSSAAGVELDPLRYRGNVLLADVPAFEEFSLIGKVVRIGAVRVAITKSIGRCTATSVNPQTTEVDVNGLKLLTAHFGHTHCGVYGTVLNEGQLDAGMQIRLEADHAEAQELVPRKRTPRFVEVLNSTRNADGSLLLTLHDSLGWLDEDESGTALRLHFPQPRWANYAISAVDGQTMSILVEAADENLQYLEALEAGGRVLASGPQGGSSTAKALRRESASSKS
ncbi:hypothetical protein AUR04nite_28500 [Glutamicibacter uratoxydans]|uniref:MOSC domain-containing protein n=1 Tax=Glutamicibacter uratoxydans TaxID=43667 RepID=A0A4Y4DVC4_GLUUR|nr:MOSC domain-containing protein [Glutamicibacter uratoxydans]GED07318.1 hypothetical protein AUR04nite_28500 [Glutamicibacter uratoxydans]